MEVSYFIRAMALGTIFMALEHTFSGILNGLNNQLSATRNRLIGLGLQMICIYSLIGNPKFGIKGFFIGFFLSSITIFTLDLITVRKRIKLKIGFKDILIKPILSSLVMLISIYFSMHILERLIMDDSFRFFISLAFGGVVYAFTMFIRKSIYKKQSGALSS